MPKPKVINLPFAPNIPEGKSVRRPAMKTKKSNPTQQKPGNP